MLHKSKYFLTMLAVFAANMVFSQNNSIGVQIGLFHYFFDDSPILNVNYPSSSKNDIFGGLFINSVGLRYTRKINSRSQIDFELQSFRERYTKHTTTEKIIRPVVGWRNFSTIGTNYFRVKPIHDKFNIVYGGGLYFRHGSETIIISRFPIGNFNGQTVYELLVESIKRNDIGINLSSGVEFIPKKWLTLYSKIDLLGFVYLNDKSKAKKMKEIYNAPQFPSRFDLSLKFGVGFNF